MTITEFARMGGLASAKSMTPEQRSERAKKAARKRWEKSRQKKSSLKKT